METSFTNSAYDEINGLLSGMISLLNEGDFQQADACCDALLHIMPGLGSAYLGKLLAEFQLRELNDLLFTEAAYTASDNYKQALYYSDQEMQHFLRTAPYENYYLRAKKKMQEDAEEKDLRIAAKMFSQISGYRDADQLSRECKNAADAIRTKEIYHKAIEMMDTAVNAENWQSAADAMACLNGYLDSAEKRNICLQKVKDFQKDKIYNSAVAPESCGSLQELQESLRKFESIRSWKDAGQKADLCKNRIVDFQKASAAKRRARFFLMIGIILSVGIACGLHFGIIPLSKYNHANDLVRNGSYTAAIDVFSSLHGFLDSEEKVREIELVSAEKSYQSAVSLMNAENFKDAFEIFKSIEGYRDSTEKAVEAENRYLNSR